MTIRSCNLIFSRSRTQFTDILHFALSVVLKRLSINHLNGKQCHVCAEISRRQINEVHERHRRTDRQTDSVSHVSRQVTKQVHEQLSWSQGEMLV